VSGELVTLNVVVAGLFVTRRETRATGTRAETSLALLGTGLPLLLQPWTGPAAADLSWVLGLALLGVIVSVASLGRSFGIAPADRGTAACGTYRLVRHPMYACEIVFVAAFALGNPSTINLVLALAFPLVQGARALGEERLLARRADYKAYAGRVRWRFVPLVF
jgi:protein-S-isoprenylcysteine O-methyltransferase Ste14